MFINPNWKYYGLAIKIRHLYKINWIFFIKIKYIFKLKKYFSRYVKKYSALKLRYDFYFKNSKKWDKRNIKEGKRGTKKIIRKSQCDNLALHLQLNLHI